jgi:molybdate transport system substrate-binding protein
MAGIRKFSVALAVVCGLAGVVTTGGPVQAESLTVGAPPSLRATFDEILPMFEKENGVTVHMLYSPSKTLHRQIEHGAPIDVVLAAGLEEVKNLHKKGLTLNGGPRIYAQTSLVLIMSATSRAIPVSFHQALSSRATRIALGDPKTSSLGDVTAQALTKLDPAYKNRFQIIRAEHGEDVVNLVHAGEADMGVVYRIDAMNSGQVRIIDETPIGVHMPVRFGQAIVSTCRTESLPIAEKFSDFLMSPRIQKLLLKYGFDPVVTTNG